MPVFVKLVAAAGWLGTTRFQHDFVSGVIASPPVVPHPTGGGQAKSLLNPKRLAVRPQPPYCHYALALARSKRVATMVLFSAGLALCGCSDASPGEQLPVHPAHGKLSVDGLPAGGALIVLYPAEGSVADQADAMPSATTDVDGTFRLSTYGQNDGAPAGEYAVTVRWYQEDEHPKQGPGQIPGFAPPVDHFQGKYNDPQKSPWHVTITEGENVLEPITIE